MLKMDALTLVHIALEAAALCAAATATTRLAAATSLLAAKETATGSSVPQQDPERIAARDGRSLRSKKDSMHRTFIAPSAEVKKKFRGLFGSAGGADSEFSDLLTHQATVGKKRVPPEHDGSELKRMRNAPNYEKPSGPPLSNLATGKGWSRSLFPSGEQHK